MHDKDINSLITIFSEKWQLSSIKPLLPKIINNYVAVAYSAEYKADIVLKILLAKTSEIEALKFFNGNSCVKLLEYDENAKIFLLEYIQPGISLKTFFSEKDTQALEIVADIIQKLHAKTEIPQKHFFKNITQWLQLLDTFESKKISLEHIEKARKLYKQLLRKKQKQYVLHGDLHHENILKSNTYGWISIDPKGVIGPLEYEVCRFIMNPIPDLLLQSNAKEIIQNRIDQFCNIFEFEKQRLIDWCFVQAILSACWTEHGGSEEFFNYFIKFAETVENL